MEDSDQIYYMHYKDADDAIHAFKLMMEDGLEYHKNKVKEINKYAGDSNIDGGMIKQELALKAEKIKWYKNRIEILARLAPYHHNGILPELYDDVDFKPQIDDTKNYLMDQFNLLNDGKKYLQDRIDELNKLGEEKGQIRLLKYHRDQLQELLEWFIWKGGAIQEFLEWNDFDGESWYRKGEKGAIKW